MHRIIWKEEGRAKEAVIQGRIQSERGSVKIEIDEDAPF